MEIRLLNKKLIAKSKLDIRLGEKAPATDVAILSGVKISYEDFSYGFEDLKHRNARYWLEDNRHYEWYFVNNYGIIVSDRYSVYNPIGVRPIFKYSEIKDQCRDLYQLNNFEVAATNFEYPQYAIDDSDFLKKIDELQKKNELIRTEKIYDINGDCPEYICDGRKIVFIKNKAYGDTRLSNKQYTTNKKGFWCYVDKVEVLVDKENDLAISKNVLLRKSLGNIYEADETKFCTTSLYNFLNNRMKYDLIPSTQEKGKNYITTININKEQIDELLTNKEIVLNNAEFKIVLEDPKIKKK